MKPKVSIIIPCYNYARFLSDAVESVIGQTYHDFEIIIVNDGSADNTEEVSAGLINKHEDVRIILINQKNRGPSAARNAGIAAAEGDYILPLDADDMLAPTFLEETVPVLDSMPDVSIAYTDWVMFGDVPESLKDRKTAEEYNLKYLLDHNFIVSTSLFRKSAWTEAGGYKEEMSKGFEDWEFWISLAELGHTGRLVNKRLFLYRKHGRSRNDGALDVNLDIVYSVRKMHVMLYYPVIYRFGRQAALAVNFIKWYVRDPISVCISRKFPVLHSLMKNIRDGLKLRSNV